MKQEEKKVTMVYDPEIVEEYRREQAQKAANERAKAEELKLKPGGNYRMSVEEKPEERLLFKTTAIWNEQLGEFYYDRKYRTIDWRSPEGEEVSIPPEDWKLLSDAIPMILNVLDAEG